MECFPMMLTSTLHGRSRSARFCLILSAGLILSLASGSLANEERTVKHKVADKRNASGIETHFVLFCAKPSNWIPVKNPKSIPGHAWFAWGKVDDPKKVINGEFDPLSISGSYGFYPHQNAGIWEILFEVVDGDMRKDFINDESHVRLVVLVKKDDAEKVADLVKDRWQACEPQGYRLFERDCITITLEVAKLLELLTPDRDKLSTPQQAIDHLAEINGR
jgi:hypothetical protein